MTKGFSEVSAAVAQFGLVFEDAPDKPEWFAIHGDDVMQQEPLAGGWTRSTLGLQRFAGRTIAAVMFGFRSAKAAAVIDMRLGELYLGAPAPTSRQPAPAGFTVEAHVRNAEGNTVQARLRWNKGQHGHAAYYDIFCIAADAEKRTWLGRVHAESFYAANAPLDQTGGVTFELIATYLEAPLTPSLPARVEIRS